MKIRRKKPLVTSILVFNKSATGMQIFKYMVVVHLIEEEHLLYISVQVAYTEYSISRYFCGTVCFMYDFEGQTHNFSALLYFCVELILSCTGVINTSYLAIKNLI